MEFSKKNILGDVLCVFALALILFSPGCKEDEVTAQEQVTALLTSAAAWESPTVTVDGVDYSDLYKEFTIAFTHTTYTTTAGEPVWAPSGTWVLINVEATKMMLDGITEVEINSIDNDFLELSVEWDEDTFEPGRIASVKGKNKFKFKKKK